MTTQHTPEQSKALKSFERAIRKAQRTQARYAETGDKAHDQIKALNACDRAYNRVWQTGLSIAELDALNDRISELRSQIQATEDAARNARQFDREVEISRLRDAELAERKGEIRYVPGVGYTSR